MSKQWPIPKISEALSARLAAANLTLVRNSKTCITLMQCGRDGSPDSISQIYARRYAFHLDFDKQEVIGFNINEYTSNYKRATIWVKREELEILLAIDQELNALLKEDAISKLYKNT